MFIYKTTIHLRDTDATGPIYFAEQQRLALEAFEHFMLSKNFTLKELAAPECPFLMPIVHAEADYGAILYAGDCIEIHLSVEKIGTSSFHMRTLFFKEEQKVGSVLLVHVAISKETKASIPIPDKLLQLLEAKGDAERRIPGCFAQRDC